MSNYSHTLVNPADHECSPCTKDCHGCACEEKDRLEQIKLNHYHSDKFYWHRYIAEYERYFKDFYPKNILEYGVLRGESIRYLHDRFPDADILGVDKDDVTLYDLPRASNIRYLKINQDDRDNLKGLNHDKLFDLIIDDGSHRPDHQANCLIEGMYSLSHNGIYIVEDIHTNISIKGSPLYVLLAIEHVKALSSHLTAIQVYSLAEHGYFTAPEILNLESCLSSINIFRRGLLPVHCWSCGKSDFDFDSLTCSCDAPLYEPNDSMSAILRKG